MALVFPVLETAYSQLESLLREAQSSKGAQFLRRMAVQVGDKVILLFVRDILWIQSKGDLIRLHGKNGDYDCRMTMADLQKKIDPRTFLRLHRNAIVNLDHAVEFTLPRSGNAFVHLSNGRHCPSVAAGDQPCGIGFFRSRAWHKVILTAAKWFCAEAPSSILNTISR